MQHNHSVKSQAQLSQQPEQHTGYLHGNSALLFGTRAKHSVKEQAIQLCSGALSSSLLHFPTVSASSDHSLRGLGIHVARAYWKTNQGFGCILLHSSKRLI